MEEQILKLKEGVEYMIQNPDEFPKEFIIKLRTEIAQMISQIENKLTDPKLRIENSELRTQNSKKWITNN